MRKAFKDRPFTYHQREDGLWSAVDERLSIGAIAKTREEAYDKLCALVLEHLKGLPDDDLEAHIAGCEVVYIDDDGRLVEEPPAAASAAG
jgi:hypothetical protein